MSIEKSKPVSESLILLIDHLINKIMMENYGYEEEYLQKILTEEKYMGILDITLTECHIIDCIQRNPLTNAVGIAQLMNITKGGVSKITAKLLKKGLIEIYRLEGNRKEIFYALTPQGKEVFRVHKRMHDKMQERISLRLTQYSEDELKIISRFIGDITELV